MQITSGFKVSNVPFELYDQTGLNAKQLQQKQQQKESSILVQTRNEQLEAKCQKEAKCQRVARNRSESKYSNFHRSKSRNSIPNKTKRSIDSNCDSSEEAETILEWCSLSTIETRRETKENVKYKSCEHEKTIICIDSKQNYEKQCDHRANEEKFKKNITMEKVKEIKKKTCVTDINMKEISNEKDKDLLVEEVKLLTAKIIEMQKSLDVEREKVSQLEAENDDVSLINARIVEMQHSLDAEREKVSQLEAEKERLQSKAKNYMESFVILYKAFVSNKNLNNSKKSLALITRNIKQEINSESNGTSLGKNFSLAKIQLLTKIKEPSELYSKSTAIKSREQSISPLRSSTSNNLTLTTTITAKPPKVPIQ